MVLKPTLEKKVSEILPEIESHLLARARALSGDVFESLLNKQDISLCADKARSLGDLSNEEFLDEEVQRGLEFQKPQDIGEPSLGYGWESFGASEQVVQTAFDR